MPEGSLVAKSLPTVYAFSRGSVVADLQYTAASGNLVLHVEGMDSDPRVLVEFRDVIGFRVLDERDLLEFWPTCSTPNGWLFEISAGGWLSQELARPGSLMSTYGTNAREFLVTGENECVSVIGRDAPVVEKHAV
jgi:hypothetical protein